MKIIAGIALYIFYSFSILSAQPTGNLDVLQKHYESFEYTAVINKADNLLLNKDKFSEQTLMQIYTLKAASHYAMGDQTNTRETFKKLFKLNENYELDNVIYSPKLVELFNDAKNDYLNSIKTKKEKLKTEKYVEKTETAQQPSLANNKINSALAKSLLLPGLGHLHLNNNTKGWVLTSAGSAVLVSMVYFIFNTNYKEKDYLTERNSHLIQTKYNEYNKSYKIRNSLIAAYAAIWLYSQIDLLFFSNDLGVNNISMQISNDPHFLLMRNNTFSLSFKIPF